jgi:hypothetical protein
VAKRERFVTSMTCPECALNGSATWEENESGNLETTIISLSHGFRTGPSNEILCADCGVKVRIIGIASGAKPGHYSASDDDVCGTSETSLPELSPRSAE